MHAWLSSQHVGDKVNDTVETQLSTGAHICSALKRNAEELRLLLAQVDSYEAGVIATAQCITRALQKGNKLLACGNGGSAADASHLTTEFVCRFQKERRPYPAISLATH